MEKKYMYEGRWEFTVSEPTIIEPAKMCQMMVSREGYTAVITYDERSGLHAVVLDGSQLFGNPKRALENACQRILGKLEPLPNKQQQRCEELQKLYQEL